MTDINNENEQLDPAMDNMLAQIEVTNFEKRADEMINKANKTGELPYGMTLEIDPVGDIDHKEGFVTCKAQIPSPQKIEKKKKVTAKKIQAIAVKADEAWERRKELYQKLGKNQTSTFRKFSTPVHTEGMKKLIEWSKQQQIREELIMEKLYPLREWARKMNP